MNAKIEYKSSSNTLRLRTKVTDNATGEELVKDISSSQEITLPAAQPLTNFNTIYKELHSKFPEIINLDKPVLLAVGIRKQMSKETGIAGTILRRWIAKYFRKSNYYTQHAEGSPRYNLDGTEAGIVSEKQQEKMNKFLDKIKTSTSVIDNNNNNNSDK